jgi:cysteine synthase A
MPVSRDLSSAVGGTPLIRLQRLSGLLGREILGKAEFENPGGSVKDRAARGILDAAEREGRLAAGGTVVEGTAGNTGIALAMLGNARGYRTIVVMPDNQASEKIDVLRAYGAEVRAVPPAPFVDERNFYHQARRLAAATPGAIFADQFENVANRQAHFETTGPEIWEATGGQLDAFVCAAGTGGTIGGVSAYLKSRDAGVRTVLVDPHGSSLWSHVKRGTLEAEGDSVTEGIGIRRITANFATAVLDDALRIGDRVMIEMAHWLAREEGLLLGGSAALNVAAAATLARTLPEGARVVTVLCDGGTRYLSKLYNPGWLEAKGLSPRGRDLSFLGAG